MTRLFRKAAGFFRHFADWARGVRLDAPHMPLWDAIRFHSHPLRGALHHYAGLSHSPGPERIRLKNFGTSIWIRPNTSDYSVYRQVFVDLEYGLLEKLENVNTILDCGANVGLASVYFLSRFPAARVVSVEPDPENAAVARRNLEPFGQRVQLVQAGVWGQSTTLALVPSSYGAGNKWGISVRAAAPEDGPEVVRLPAVDIPALIAKSGGAAIDILKIDIERSEIEVFGPSSAAWLPSIRNLVIELHGDDCDEAFFGALREWKYRLDHFGDLTYCFHLERGTQDSATPAASGAAPMDARSRS